MKTEEYLTEYFEMNDGEYFCIQNRDFDSEYPSDQILLTRKDAIDLAKDIFRILGNGKE